MLSFASERNELFRLLGPRKSPFFSKSFLGVVRNQCHFAFCFLVALNPMAFTKASASPFDREPDFFLKTHSNDSLKN